MNSVHISFSFTISCVLCALCLFIIDVTSRGYVWEANEERNWHPLLTLARWHLVGYPGWKGDTVSFTCNPVDSTGPLACNSWSRLILAPWLVILQLLCLLFLNIANFYCFGFFHVSFHSNPPCDYHSSTCNSVSVFVDIHRDVTNATKWHAKPWRRLFENIIVASDFLLCPPPLLLSPSLFSPVPHIYQCLPLRHMRNHKKAPDEQSTGQSSTQQHYN